MAIKIRDLSFPAFTNYALLVRWRSNGALVDLTNWTPHCEVRTKRDNVLVCSFTCVKTITPSDAYVVMSITPADSLLLENGDFRYSLVMTNNVDSTQIRELLRGAVLVADQITVVV